MTWRKVANGLLGAVINSAASAVTLVIVDPLQFNLTGEGLIALGKAMIVSGIVGAALYLKTHPLPEE